MQYVCYCNLVNIRTQWIFMFILSLSVLICKSQKRAHHALDYIFYYESHHYQFTHHQLVHQPNISLLIDQDKLHISIINASSLSYIVNGKNKFDFFDDTNYDTISYVARTPSSSSTKRRTLSRTDDDSPQVTGSWLLLLQLKDTRRGYFQPELKKTGNENEYNQDANAFSRLGAIHDKRTNFMDPASSKYTFKLMYNNKDGSTDTLIWKQSTWPTSSQIVSGYKAISVPNQRTAEDSALTFKGLALSTQDGTYLDGNGEGAEAWNSVGQNTPAHDGIPAFNGKIAWSESLYVFRPPQSKAHEIFTKFKKSTSNHVTKGNLVGDKQFRSFESAKAVCKFHYGDMVSIKSDEENAEVHKFCQEELGGRCWIGLQAEPNPATWNDVKTWVDGTEYGAYKHWSPGEPNNYKNNEKCTEMWSNSLWNDATCDSKRHAICSKVAPAEYAGYVAVNKKMTWSGAERWCKAQYGDTAGLAVIKTFEDNNNLRSACGNTDAGATEKECWIGLTDTKHQFSKWADEPLTDVTYKNWLEGSPVDQQGLDCVVMSITSDGKFGWTNKLCMDKAYFICNKGIKKKSAKTKLRMPYRYIGCYRDTANRALTQGPKQWGYNIEKCYQACGEFKYFALQAGGWCSCENSFKSATQYGTMWSCPKNKLGGPWGNDLFENVANAETNVAETQTPPKQEKKGPDTSSYEWIGCYKDTAARSFSEGPKNWGYTVDKCYTACEGYKYFALQAGSWCSCENSFTRVVMYGKSNRCSDAHTGGTWANDVYKALPKAQSDDKEWKFVLGIRDAKKQLFKSSFPQKGTENTNNPKADTFSVLGALKPEVYRDEKDKKFTFKLVYGYPDGTRDTIIWKQSSWPTTTNTVQEYEAVTVPKQRKNCGTFKGLALSGSRKHTYLDGNGRGSCWWNSVGTMKLYRNGIPGFNLKVAKWEKLYIRRPIANTVTELKETLEKQRKKHEGLSKRQKKEMSRLKETVRKQGLLHKKHLGDLTAKQRKELSRLEKLLRKQKAAQKKQMREMGNTMKRHGEKQRKYLLRAMQKHGATQRQHIRDMKREILREMKHSFGRNDQRTVLLQKIHDIKHQQTNLELQHKIMTTRKQQQHELERQTNDLMQRQIEWQKQRELQRRKRILNRQELLRKQHEMRLKEHSQLMNGLKGFLMAFGRLYRNHVPPSPQEKPLQSIQNLGSGALQKTAKRMQKKSKPKASNGLHGFRVPMVMNPNNRPIGYETEWTQYIPPATMLSPFGMTNWRNFGDKSAEMRIPPPPPLMPPIPPIPSLRRRRLLAVDRDTLDFMEVTKCALDENYGELCATYDSQNDVFSFDVTKLTEKRLKEGRDKNVMDHGDDSEDVIDYEPLGDLNDSLRHFIVYRYEFDHLYDGLQDIQCNDNDNSDVLSFKVCLILDKKHDDVLIYVDVMDDALETKQYIQSMEHYEFMRMSDENWNDVINIDEANHIKKCRNLTTAKICVDVYDENMFIVELKV